MKTLTAWDDGELKTLTVDHWCKLRPELNKKFIYQRLRNGYTEDETINLPRGEKSAKSQNMMTGQSYGSTFSGLS